MQTHYPIIRGPINYNDSDSRWWLDEEFDMPASNDNFVQPVDEEDWNDKYDWVGVDTMEII